METINTESALRNLLIIDDEVEIVKALQRQFRKNSNVFVANSAREGYEIMCQHEIYVVVSDQRMPEMTGVEFFARIKHEFPDAIRLILTGYADIEAIINAINDGNVFRYVSKPWDPVELSTIINEAFDKYHLMIQNKKLIKQLSEANESLEGEVQQRTRELSESNEQLKALNATKDKFFSIIAHDLRGPIGGFKSILELMISDFDLTDTEALKRILQVTLQSANTTFDLLENLLAWARSQRNELEFSPVALSLSEVASRAVDPFQGMAREKHIVIRNQIQADARVHADENMLMTVFRNLVSNALKFSHPRSQVLIDAVRQRDQYTISVQDSGVGIAPENVSRIFNKGAHYSTSGTRNEKGSGLGLMLCRDFVEKHGGEIWVERGIQEGTVFKFTLPAEPAG